MKKSILKITLLTLSIFVSPLIISTNVFAAPEVIIDSEANNIPDDIVQQIVEENPNSEVINILGYGELEESESNEISSNQINNIDLPKKVIPDLPSNQVAQAVYTKPKTTKKITNRKQQAKDVFKFSVAKGEHVTLSKTYTASLTGSISGKFRNKADIGAIITITGEFKRGTQYDGPPEDSKYNSREFRMKFFQQTGTYKQVYYKQLWLTGKLVSSKKIVNTGSYKKPVSWASYSLLSKQTNTTY